MDGRIYSDSRYRKDLFGVEHSTAKNYIQKPGTFNSQVLLSNVCVQYIRKQSRLDNMIPW